MSLKLQHFTSILNFIHCGRVYLKSLLFANNTLITARKRSFGQGNVFTGVCLSLTETPGQQPPWTDPRPARQRTPDRDPTGQRPLVRQRAGGTHPIGMHSCLICRDLTIFSQCLESIFHYYSGNKTECGCKNGGSCGLFQGFCHCPATHTGPRCEITESLFIAFNNKCFFTPNNNKHYLSTRERV